MHLVKTNTEERKEEQIAAGVLLVISLIFTAVIMFLRTVLDCWGAQRAPALFSQRDSKALGQF